MHNQAVNSLAFISARYTFQAVELVSLMAASHLYAVCQALDLRVLQVSYLQALGLSLYNVNCKVFGHLLSHADFDELHGRIWDHIQVTWLQSTTKDSEDRYAHLIDSALGIIAKYFITLPKIASSSAFEALATWKNLAFDCLAETYTTMRSRFFQSQNTAEYLGHATRKLYLYVRRSLGVPFHQGLRDHPHPNDNQTKLTIGSWISVIYEALRDGRLHEPVMESLAELRQLQS